jgi:hypothetical protein
MHEIQRGSLAATFPATALPEPCHIRVSIGFNVSIVACYAPKLLARTEAMSFDLGVWYPHKRIRNEEATELYVRLCGGDTRGAVPHPAIDAFYAELTARHPEIDTIPEGKIDDHDYCPWSCKLDYSPSHVIMTCVWSKATHVHQLVQGLARKHGLALYDPQSEEVIYQTAPRVPRPTLAVLPYGYWECLRYFLPPCSSTQDRFRLREEQWFSTPLLRYVS